MDRVEACRKFTVAKPFDYECFGAESKCGLPTGVGHFGKLIDRDFCQPPVNGLVFYRTGSSLCPFVTCRAALMTTSKTIIIIISYPIPCAVLTIPWSPVSQPPAKDERLGLLTCVFQFLKLETTSRSLNSPYSVFSYFTTLTENADPLFWLWLAAWSTF